MPREFEILNANINVNVNSKTAEANLDKVSAVINKTTASTKLTIDEFVKLSQEAAKTSSTVKGLNATLVDNGIKFNISAKGAETFAVKVSQEANKTAETISELDKRFTVLRDNNLQTGRTFKQVGTDIADSFSLITRGGSVLVGLRQTFFGLSESSNIFARALDSLTRNSNNLTNVNNRVQQSALRVARTLSDIGTAGEAAVKVTAELAKTKDIAQVREFSQFNRAIQQVTNEYQRLERTIQSGGKPTRETLARINTETRNLELSFKLLEQQGILPEAELNNLKEVLTTLRSGSQATKLLNEQMKILEKEEKKAADQAKKVGGNATEGGNSGKKSWSLFFNLFSNNTKTINNVDNSFKQVNKTISETGRISTSTGSIMAGVFGGNLLTGALFRLQSAISSLPGILIGAASNAAETQNRFEAVFTDLTAEAEEFTQTLASKVGRDPFQIKDSLSSLQSFNIGLGFSNEASLKMSETTQRLILDFASFNNITDEDSTRRFQAALSGSSEVMDKFGVNIKEAALEQESFRTGLNKSSSELSEQEKVMLRLSIISRSMTDQGAIGDAVRTSGSFANQTKALNANLSQLATDIGTQLLPAIAPFLAILNDLIRFITPAIVSSISTISQAVTQFLTPIATALSDVFNAENTTVAVENLKIVVVDAINSIISFLGSATESAFDWGVDFVSMVADGIFDAANSILMDAVNYVADVISGFLQPGSPPEEGPLSTIDQWGSGLMDTFTSSIDGDKVARTLDQQLADATKSILQIRQEIIDAEKAGYVPPELLERLALAEQEKQNIEDQIAANEELAGTEKDLGKAEKSSSKSGSGGSNSSPKERVGVEKKTAQQIRDDALTVLDQQLKDGTIKYEDYVKEKLKIETKFYQDTLEAGEAVNQQTIDNVKNLQGEVDKLSEDKKKAKKGIDAAVPEVETFLGDLFDRTGNLGQDVGVHIVDSIGTGLSESVSKLEENTRSLVGTIGPILFSVLDDVLKVTKITKFINSLRVGEGIFAAIFNSLKLTPLVIKFLEPIEKLVIFVQNSALAKGITFLLDRLGIFGTLIRKLTGLFLQFSGPIGLVVTLWAHWDLIVAGFNTALNSTREFIENFIDNLGGLEAAQELFSALSKSANGFFIRIKGIVTVLLRDLGDIDFGAIFDALLSGDFSGAISILSEGLSNAFGKAFDSLGTLLNNSQFDDILRTLFNTAIQTASDLLITKLTALKQRIIEALPPGILSFIDSVSQKFNSFSTFVTNLGAKIVSLGEFFAFNLTPSFDSIQNSFKEFIATNAPQITEAITRIQSIWNTLSTAFLNAFTTVNEKLEPSINRLAQTLGFAGDDSSAGKGALLLQFFGNLVALNVDFALNLITIALDVFVRALAFVDTGLKTAAPAFNILVGVLGIVADGALNAVSTFVEFVKEIVNLFIGLHDDLVGDEGIVNSISSGVYNILVGIKDVALNALNSITGDVIDGFKNLGIDTINGLLEGMKDAEDKVISFLSDLITDRIIGPAKSLLGIQSPSLVFADIGASVMEGFNEGLDSVPPTLVDAIGAAADDAEKILDETLGDAQTKVILDRAKDLFEANAELITSLGSDAGADFLNQLLSSSINFEKLGLGEEQIATVGRSIETLVGNTITIFEDRNEAFVDSTLESLNTISEQTDSILSSFNTTVENIRFQTNTARNTLEDAFGQPITDDFLQSLYDAVQAGEDFGGTLNDSIILAFEGQQKLNDSVAESVLLNQQVADIMDSIAATQPVTDEIVPTSELDQGLELLDSLSLGIDATTSDVLAQLALLTQQMIDQMNASLEISSPSKVFMDIGTQAGIGLLEGLSSISDNIPTVASDLTTALTTGLNSDALIPANLPNVDSTSTNPNGNVIITVNNNVSNDLDLALVERRILNTIRQAVKF